MATTLAKISIKDSSSWNTYLNLIYPVGSVYFANNNTSPATRFGGTWAAISNKKYITTWGSYTTGGVVDSVIANTNLPTDMGGVLFRPIYDSQAENDSMEPFWQDKNIGTGIFGSEGIVKISRLSWSGTHRALDGQASITNGNSFGISLSGGGQPFHPAYQSFYCWVRTA